MQVNDSYNIIETEDGSFSLYSKEFDQLMHAREGAYTEALSKHVFPSKILCSNDKVINILDIGFGAGYNPLALIMQTRDKEFEKINIFSLEFSKDSYSSLAKIYFNDEKDKYFDKIKQGFLNNIISFENVNINFLFGDARESIRNLSERKIYFDAVFHDPFSPAKNSELWTVDLFKAIGNIIKNNTYLTTYSSALQIRRGMIEAGFYIGDLVCDDLPKTGTIASKTPFEGSFDNIKVEEIFKEILSVPYRDKDLSLSREEISENRILERRRLKNQNRSSS
ncbi:MAG TPA: MnmC family methyltransferase [Spirochaetota bacterium]|nr:MnmC family methyltransferase [Spirochaetota bacterium]HOR44397.1 MnmC family methyltransferase [Spirochaetota bacterium]HPK55912.1 MnmC family methyltransferase [Spirochaetota bacterium]